MLQVKISRNYTFPDLGRQTPGGKWIWDGIQFTEAEIREADFVVILNQPAADIRIRSRQGGAWLFLQEPPYTRNEYFKYHFRFVDKVISGFPDDIAHNENAQAGLPWHINKTYDELVALKAADLSKEDRVSWITSSNNMFPGHQPRLDFIDFLKEKRFDFDLFGRGFQPIDDKFDGIAPYKYSIAVENYSSRDYWTEKAIDCFLSWTMPVYFGCTNFGDYFPEGSYLQVDINKPGEALEKIKNAMAEKVWDKNLSAIAEARDLVLNKYQLFPMIAERINQALAQQPAAQKKIYRIPKNGLTREEELKKKIRNLFIRK